MISLQYLCNISKKLTYEVDVLRAGKDKSLLQVDAIILMGFPRHAQSTRVNLCLCDISRKKLGIKLET